MTEATKPETLTAPSTPLVIHIALFVAACVTTTWHGGVWFSSTLMGILLAHEAGHYVAARVHKVDVSLPYFIPLPPQISLGTLGAIIKMPESISSPSKLFDVGAAGPVAGVVIALPCLVIGLLKSELGPIDPDAMIEGNSLLYAGIKYLIFGRWLPADGMDVQLHPMAFAAWVGLLVTMINLIPVGQLDGGHIARAVLGARHESFSKRLHLAMPIIGLAFGVLLLSSSVASGHSIVFSLLYAARGVMPWMVWALMLWWMRSRSEQYHPPTSNEPLDRRRQWMAVGMLILFISIFTPVPFRAPL
jgi:membrane-associated protease RseP (regulator of RpoE activity)